MYGVSRLHATVVGKSCPSKSVEGRTKSKISSELSKRLIINHNEFQQVFQDTRQ